MKSNILLAFRNIIKNRFNSIVTVVGLTIAFACLLLIHLYVSQEKSYNNFHKNRNNIFRINYTYKFADGVKGTDILLDNKLSEIIKEKVPQVSRSTAFRSAYQPTLKFEDSNFEERLCIVDPDFFNMFNFNLVLGNKDEIFKNPDEIVITLRLAEKLQAVKSCTKEELLGKPVFFMDTGNRPFKISGIIEDVPRNSSIRFDALIPFKYEAAFTQSNNDLGNSEIFYEVDKNGNKRLADEQVSRVVTEYYRKLIDRLQSKNILANTTDCFTPFTISLNDVYLGGVHSDYERNGNKKGLYILSAIGFLILIIAGSNFIMLTLAQSFNKAGEVVIRKAMGAGKRNIFNLFFVESAIVSIVSMGLGIYLCFLLLPMFSRLVQAEIYTDLIDIPLVVIFVIACLLIVTLTSLAPVTKTAKIIPTMLASRQMPARNRKGATWMFVSLQYALSIFLIILTISIVRQTNYMKYKSLGFSSDNIISLRLTQIYNKDGITLRDKLKDYSGIINAALTDRNFTGPRSSQFVKNARGENIETRLLTVDQNYISTLDLKLIQGENFKEENIKPEDHSVIINEKLLSHFDFKGNAVGQIINIGGRECNIIGVVKDFHFDSMKEKIQPLALVSSTNMANGYSYLLMKYQPTQLSRLIPYIKKTWKEVAPGKILDFKFWNEQLNQRYEAEERWSRIIGYAALISIIISSLGLLGLTLLLINSCTKEIGIRRVNGAKVSEILTMLNKDFIKWVVVAFVIACPIAWYTIHKWLENFAYKTTLSWWIFALAAGLALGIALLTVSWQSWRAATRNPVEALRYE